MRGALPVGHGMPTTGTETRRCEQRCGVRDDLAVDT